MKEATKQNSLLGYLHWLIGVAIMLCGYILPASAPLTPMGVKILAIFVGMVYLWCMVNPIGGSLLALFMVGIVGYAPFSEIIAQAISDPNWIIIFFSCILFMSAIDSGMPSYISQAIFKATQGFVTGRPMVLIFILMCAAFVLSALTEIIPTTLMFWAICYAIISELHLEKTDRYSMLLVMSSFLGAMLGNAALPFKGATLIIISAFTTASGLAIPYGPYIVINLFCSLLIMLIYCLAVKWLFRMDLSKVKNIDGHILAQSQLEPMSISVKAHLIAVFGFIIGVLLASFLPAGNLLAVFLANMGTGGIAIMMIILLFIVKDDGKPCIHFGKAMAAVPWNAVFMCLASIYMASALKNKDVTGILPWLRTMLNPILGGHGEFIFAVLIFLLAMVLTCFFHNGALGNMLMPILFAIAEANGYHATAIAAMMTLAINMAFLLPSASNYAPLLHGNREYISTKDIWTYGLFFEVLTFAVFLFLGLPIAKIMM